MLKKQEFINKNFAIPYYVFEEITDYIEQTAKGNNKSMKWENIISLLNMAVINKNITPEQSVIIKQIYCREK